jgi:hypothetical protein
LETPKFWNPAAASPGSEHEIGIIWSSDIGIYLQSTIDGRDELDLANDTWRDVTGASPNNRSRIMFVFSKAVANEGSCHLA